MKRRWNIGILAHVDAGKTTITEQLLLLGGSIRTAGSVDQGTAQTDWLEVERRRGISVKTACAEFQLEGKLIGLVDTPGHVDFAGEVARSLQVLDGAVLVVSAAEGVQAHTKTIFRALQKMRIPTLIAVNKVDRVGVDLDALKGQLARQISGRCMYLQEVEMPGSDGCRILPESIQGENRNFTPEKREDSAPDGYQEKCGNSAPDGYQEKYRNSPSDGCLEKIWERIFEQLADFDEELEEQYLEEGNPGREVLEEKLRAYTWSGQAYPVVFTSAKEGKGIRQLAEAMITYLPDASMRATKDLFGIIFQVTHDPVMGKAAHIRLFGGRLASRDVVPVAGQEPDQWEKATQIRRIQGGKFLDTGEMEAGEIAAVYGLSGCRAGDIVGGEGLNLDGYQSAMRPQPLLMLQVKPADAEKEIELAAALTELSEEDPLLHYEQNPLTGQMYLRAMGRVQIEILEEVLKTRFGLEIICSSPTVVYKEKPGHMAVGLEVYTMPKPCWAVVELRIEPLPPGSGIVFSSVVKEDLPYRYQNHVRASLLDTFRQGIYGWEVTDAKVTLIGGEYHHVHTHPLDFFVATPVAALRALKESGVVLLEPYVKLWLSAEEAFVGKVLGQIVAMRGEFSPPVMEEGMFTLEAVVPLREAMDYPVEFRSLTSGKGSYAMDFDSYRPCEEGFIETLPRRGVDPLDRAKWILSCRSAY